MFAIGFVNNIEATIQGDLHCLWHDKLRIKAAFWLEFKPLP
jgi:hypothetical protein